MWATTKHPETLQHVKMAYIWILWNNSIFIYATTKQPHTCKTRSF